jgi:hypothetical protein
MPGNSGRLRASAQLHPMFGRWGALAEDGRRVNRHFAEIAGLFAARGAFHHHAWKWCAGPWPWPTFRRAAAKIAADT